MVRNVGVALLVGGLVACSGGADDSEFAEDRLDQPDNGKNVGTVIDDGTQNNNNAPGATCAAESTAAKRGALDIIFVIDSSGSMALEMAQVRQNINNFSASFAKSGLDAHVVMITPKGTSGNSICVPAPLGGAACADNLPTFRHINTPVGSTNSFEVILQTYPQWSASLRTDATKVFVEVTDDESRMSSSDFESKLTTLAPEQFGSPSKPHYIFNSIVGWQDGTAVLSAQKCSSAVNIGSNYQTLSQKTGGIVDSVCKTDYSGVLGNLAKNISDRLACDFRLPVATGQTDINKVLVTFTPSGGATKSLVRVTDASKCGQFADGWYYDDNTRPTVIKLCDTTCSAAQASVDAKIGVQLGCAVPAPK